MATDEMVKSELLSLPVLFFLRRSTLRRGGEEHDHQRCNALKPTATTPTIIINPSIQRLPVDFELVKRLWSERRSNEWPSDEIQESFGGRFGHVTPFD
jgi:hypothetical protein